MSIDLKSIVARQIPEFAREDYPLFVSFIEAYYEYADKYEKRNLTELRDVDQTLDSFIQYFKNELDIFGSTYTNIDQRLFLRKIKEVLVAKGIESSYTFLFKLLYGKTAEISYPWDQVLKASDGKWNQDMSLFIDIKTGDAERLIGNRITVNGKNQKIKVYVDKVRLVDGTVYEVFISRYYYGDIKVGYTVTFEDVTGEILPTTSAYTIALPGSGFKVGQIITGTALANGKLVTQRLKITRVDENGGVINIATLSFGYGYDTDFYLIQAAGNVSANSSLTVYRNDELQFSIANDSSISQYTDYGYILNPDYVVLPYTDPTYAATFLQQFYEDSINLQESTPNYLLIKFNIGAVAKYQGHYSSNDGFLDDDIYLQDSYRWQKYSYLITVDEKLETYKSVIKSYLHPAGTALFGEYQIQNNYAPGIEATQELGQWSSYTTFTTINKNVPNDYTYVSGSGGRIMIDPYFSPDYAVADELYNPPVTEAFTG
jgi:hypothetical protein